MKILVTGGAGFLGANLVPRLLEAGHDVVVLDNLSSGRPENVPDGAAFIEHDVTDPMWPKLMPFRPDRIFHMACLASPVWYLGRPLDTIRAAVLGTDIVLGYARKVEARVVMTSTSEIYGDPGIHPQPEWYHGVVAPWCMRSVYDEGKRAAETLGCVYRSMDVDVRAVRLFNSYGPHMRLDDGRMVPTFVRQALLGRPITVHGDGTQTRSLCYVDDTVAGILAMMAAEDLPDPPVVNIGNPDERSVLEIAKIVARLAGMPQAEIVFRPRPEADPNVRCPNIELARKHLGWAPAIGLEDGLRRTVEDIRKAL